MKEETHISYKFYITVILKNIYINFIGGSYKKELMKLMYSVGTLKTESVYVWPRQHEKHKRNLVLQ